MRQNLKKQISTLIEAHRKLLAQFEGAGIEPLVAASNAIIKSLTKGGTIYICGNGGSAADAQHIAAELIGRFEHERKALPAVALTTDTSVITSVANDYGYQNAFTRQVEALVKKGDILWALSTSGRSPNIIAAIKTARKKGAVILAFTGKTDSPLERTADICFCACSGVTARAQEMHQLAYHIICGLVEKNIGEKLKK